MVATFLPLWARERGVPIATVGLLLSLRGLVTLVARVGYGRLIHAVGRRTVLLGSLLLAAAGRALLPLVGVPGASPRWSRSAPARPASSSASPAC
jgi:predicted MFS family arabinose efflux permease